MEETNNHTHSPDDFLAALYLYSDIEEFTSNKEKIHSAIKELIETFSSRVGDLTEEFVFSERESFPFSKTVEHVLMRLQLSNVIISENPRFYKYRVNNSIKNLLKKEIEKHLGREEVVLLKEMSKEFGTRCAFVI